MCVGVCVYEVVWVLGSWSMGHGFESHHSQMNLLPLPPTTPTSPPSCEWVPGVSWGTNHSSFSLNGSGPGGTLGAHTTCCEKVAGPILWVPSPFSRSLLAQAPSACLVHRHPGSARWAWPPSGSKICNFFASVVVCLPCCCFFSFSLCSLGHEGVKIKWREIKGARYRNEG